MGMTYIATPNKHSHEVRIYILQVNHHFRQHNSYYGYIEHPRWGSTQSIITSKAVNKGEELFTFYGYNDKSIDAVPWYWDLKRQVEKEERLGSKRAQRINKS